MTLAALLERPDIWRGRDTAGGEQACLATGWAELDSALGGGWPRGAVTELLTDHWGIGELSLLLPALRALDTARWQVWINPPYRPYLPALAAAGLDPATWFCVYPPSAKEVLWTLEQVLRSGACGAVLGWPEGLESRALRRLQLAAEAGDALTVLYRPRRAAREAAPAAVRLALEPGPAGLQLHILKRRGGWAGAAVGPLATVAGAHHPACH